MRLLYFLATLMVFSTGIFAQNKNVFYVGHSVCGTVMPNMVDDIAIDAGFGHSYGHQLIWGACLSKNWDQHDSNVVIGDDSWVELATGNYNVVTLIEQIPLTEVINSNQWGCDYKTSHVGGLFYDLAVNNNPNTDVYFVEVWNEFNRLSPTAYTDWKQLNDSQLQLYEQVVDSINLQHNGSMCIIPVRLALQTLTDSIEANAVPGLTSWLGVFDTTDTPTNTVHLNEIGNYFSALVYYATIYKSSPVGLTNITKDENNFNYSSPSLATALKMQEIVWDVVSSYSYACASPTSINEIENNNEVTIYPNPTSNVINIKSELSIKTISISDLSGKQLNVYDTNQQSINEINLSALKKGIYFIHLLTIEDNQIVKKVIKH